MLYYSPLLTLIVLGALPVYVALMLAAMPVFRRRLNEKFVRGADNQAFLVEAVTNMQTLKAGATEPQAARRWDEQLAAYVASSFRVISLGAVAGEGIHLVQKLVTVGILWLGALQVIDGAMTVGGLVAFNMLASRLAQPVLRLAQLWQPAEGRIAVGGRAAGAADEGRDHVLRRACLGVPATEVDERLPVERRRSRDAREQRPEVLLRKPLEPLRSRPHRRDPRRAWAGAQPSADSSPCRLVPAPCR